MNKKSIFSFLIVFNTFIIVIVSSSITETISFSFSSFSFRRIASSWLIFNRRLLYWSIVFFLKLLKFMFSWWNAAFTNNLLKLNHFWLSCFHSENYCTNYDSDISTNDYYNLKYFFVLVLSLLRWLCFTLS